MIFDAHCDVLYRLSADSHLDFKKNNGLDITLPRLIEAGGKIQCFAIFVSSRVPVEQKFSEIIHQISLFHDKILPSSENIVHVKSRQDVEQLTDNQIGAILTLEGCDGICNDLSRLRYLFECGVFAVGMTWNHANLCADGILEPRGAGLTELGFEVIRLNNKYKKWSDVSHLSIKGFWDILETADFPIASHSNAKTICGNPRNLNDEQIHALFKKNGVIGLNFFSEFLNEEPSEASIDDVIRHIDYFCSLGGIRQIGFGSDFDGIDKAPKGLENYSKYPKLIEACLKHYSEDQVKGFAFNNFYQAMPF